MTANNGKYKDNNDNKNGISKTNYNKKKRKTLDKGNNQVNKRPINKNIELNGKLKNLTSVKGIIRFGLKHLSLYDHVNYATTISRIGKLLSEEKEKLLSGLLQDW